MAGGRQVIETALWGLSLLITAAVCFWVGVGVGVGRGEGVPRDRVMETRRRLSLVMTHKQKH